MKKLGLRPVPGSGCGELHKEDGENDYILCQLKSTEALSIKIDKLDVEKLLYHAELVNKIPLFAIQFLNGPILLATVPEELGNISKYLNEGLFERKQIEIYEPPKQKQVNKVEASSKSMEEILKEARSELEEEQEPDEGEDSFILQAFEKRKQRKINQKGKDKWPRQSR